MIYLTTPTDCPRWERVVQAASNSNSSKGTCKTRMDECTHVFQFRLKRVAYAWWSDRLHGGTYFPGFWAVPKGPLWKQSRSTHSYRIQSSGAVWKSRWPSWVSVPNKPYGFCGRQARCLLYKIVAHTPTELRSCVKVEMAVLGSRP